MKIVLLAHSYPDYLQDIVYHGLVTLLGADSVVEWPRIARYHEAAAPETKFAQLHFDFPDAPRAASVSDELRDADGVVIATLRDEAYPLAREVLALPRRPPTVFLDGEDDPYVREIVTRVDAYLKREVPTRRPSMLTPFALQRLYFATARAPLLAGPLRRPLRIARDGDPQLRPLPLGMIDSGVRLASRERYDVAFMGVHSSTTRARLVPQLRGLEKDGLRVFIPDAPVPWLEYLQILADSRACVSLRGAGWDTYRYWEIPYVGSLLVSEPLGIRVPHNFEDGKEALFVPPERLVERLPQILARDTRGIAQAGRDKLMTHHLSTNRARVVLDALGLKA